MRLRQAARAVVLDPADRILLVRFDFPARSVWAAPGGGLEPGETHEHALARELREEAGLEVVDLGPWIWSRTHVIPFLDGSADGQVERYYLLRTPAFEPAPVFTRGAARIRVRDRHPLVDAAGACGLRGAVRAGAGSPSSSPRSCATARPGSRST